MFIIVILGIIISKVLFVYTVNSMKVEIEPSYVDSWSLNNLDLIPVERINWVPHAPFKEQVRNSTLCFNQKIERSHLNYNGFFSFS